MGFSHIDEYAVDDSSVNTNSSPQTGFTESAVFVLTGVVDP